MASVSLNLFKKKLKEIKRLLYKWHGRQKKQRKSESVEKDKYLVSISTIPHHPPPAKKKYEIMQVNIACRAVGSVVVEP